MEIEKEEECKRAESCRARPLSLLEPSRRLLRLWPSVCAFVAGDADDTITLMLAS